MILLQDHLLIQSFLQNVLATIKASPFELDVTGNGEIQNVYDLDSIKQKLDNLNRSSLQKNNMLISASEVFDEFYFKDIFRKCLFARPISPTFLQHSWLRQTSLGPLKIITLYTLNDVKWKNIYYNKVGHR